MNGNSITGTPTVPGVYSIGVTVTDANNATAATTIGLSVFGILTRSLPQAFISLPYSFQVTAAGGTRPYAFSVSGLPPNFALTNLGWLSGTAAAAGMYTISVTATDAHGVSNSASFPFVITRPATLKVPGGPLSDAATGTPYSQTLSAAGGTPPYSWTLPGGSLPDGTNLQPTGALAGTPVKPGSYTFTAEATDQTGASAVGTFSVDVAALPVTITTPSPPASGMVSIEYPVQVFSTSGGVPPYTYTVTPNTLPPGLTLSSNGAITGSPAIAGNFPFTLTATDSNGQTGNASFQISVRAFSTDLFISAGALSFSLAAGATLLPATQAVQVQSTDVTQTLSWSTAIATPAAAWLSVSTGGATPGFFSVVLTSAASSLAASGTPYLATIVISCLAPSPCAGSSQTIAVSLLVSAAPPKLTVLENLLSFTTSSTNPQAITQSVVIENTGGGNIGFASFTCPATWCEINALPVSIGVQTISITADPTGLTPGYYFTDLTIHTSAGTAVVPVSFFITARSSLALSPAGIQWAMPTGGVAATPETSFLVTAPDTGPVSWTATVLPGAPWLNLATPNGSSTAAAPGVVSFSINQTQAAALAPNVYYGTIRVAPVGAASSPQDFQVVLDVTAATVTPTPVPSPAGLIFLTSAGGGSSSAAPPPQMVQVFASSATAVPYQAAVATADGSSWLSVNPTTGTTSAASPAQSSVTVSPGGLAPGVYHGSISYSLAGAAVPSVNVALVVKASQSAAASCTPTQIIPTQTGLLNNFAAPASIPTPIVIQLVDDCGSPVMNGQILTTFSNGDPPLDLNLENSSLGLYSGTWTPRNSGSQVTVTATLTPIGAATSISGTVVPNNVPVMAPDGTLHTFTPAAGAPLAPGTIVQIHGSWLATQTVAATTLPLPTNLGGTSVVIGGLQAPLFSVSPGKVTAQIPFELTPGQSYEVVVSNNGALSTPESIETIAATPGVDALPSGYANAQHTSDGSPITDASPARPGEYIVIYLAGMGPTTVPVASGVGSPSSPPAQTVDTPTITLNSEPVSFQFSGLTPGLAGLYQIVLQVPADAQSGDLLLVVSQTGFQGSPVILAVRQVRRRVYRDSPE
jgi:large repetitive protein